jgi:phage replication O-like protein O
MTTPQKEKGFLGLASGSAENDLWLALIRAQLSGTEYQIVLFVIRKTYGYGKKEDWISLSQFMKIAGRSKQGIIDAITAIEGKQIIHVRREFQKNFYSFNKKFSEWSLVNTGVPVKKNVPVSSPLPPLSTFPESPSQPRLTNKRKRTKKTLTKENPSGVVTARRTPTPGFFPPLPMSSDFVVEPDGTSTKRLPPQKRKNVRAAFDWNDDAELVRVMKQTCGFTTLENGRKPQDNWARHILVKLYKILVDDYGRDDLDAIDHIRSNMEEFCIKVQRARDTNKFLWSKLTTLKSIYYELGTIFETVKTPSGKSTSHLSL